MKKLWVAGCAVLLAGCQTDADVRSKPPLNTFSSSKSADAAVTCLIPSLGKTYSAAAPSNFRFVAQTIAPGSEYDVVPTDAFVNGHYTFTVNVKSSGKGSKLSLYKGQMMLPSLTNAMRAGIQACL